MAQILNMQKRWNNPAFVPAMKAKACGHLYNATVQLIEAVKSLDDIPQYMRTEELVNAIQALDGLRIHVDRVNKNLVAVK